MNAPVSASDRPVLRLKPKANVRAIRRGAPWVFDNELVMDRRSKKIPPGTIAILEDAERQPLGTVAVNPASRIVARMLDRDSTAVIDQAWLTNRLHRALALRDRLYPTPYYRLVHAEADGLPGVIIDRFGDTAVVQPNTAWADHVLTSLVAALQDVTGVTTVLKNSGGRGRALEGMDDLDATLAGRPPAEPLPVEMNGATYFADLIGGQKTGLFYDQRENHAFAARLAPGARVLDVFSHVGGFGLAALAGGAASVVCVDGSQTALDLARQGAVAMGRETQFTARQGDAFDQLQQMQEQMMQAQEDLKKETVTASAGGGALKITLTGDQRCTAVEIDPELLKDADAGMLQDLVMTAMNKALEESRNMAAERLGPLSQGLNF